MFAFKHTRYSLFTEQTVCIVHKKKPCRGYMIGYKSSMLVGYYVS